MQVIAHPDDDILFMNPDLAAWIQAGLPTVSVYLTSGESDLSRGVYYAASRQRGTRAAYAAMAGVPNEWTSYELAIDKRHSVELYRLKGRPDIRLVWVNLPDDNNPNATGGRHALTRLWDDSTGHLRVQTIVPADGAVPEQYSYTRAGVIGMLTALLKRFQPTVIRSQDPSPDARYQHVWQRFHDHPDHVVTARFAREAAQRYFTAGTDHRAVVLSYRDYNVAQAPVNLSPSARKLTRKYFAVYAEHDSEVSLGAPYDAWIARSYYRWPRGGSWLVADDKGRLHAFTRVGYELLHWTRDSAGWSKPVRVRAEFDSPLWPSLALTAAGESVAVFATAGSPARVRVFMAGQWRDLGSPGSQPAATAAAQLGAPSAVGKPGGGSMVFVRNEAGGISMRSVSKGQVSQGWRVLGGQDVQGRPTVLRDDQGRIHVFATTTGSVLHWTQSTSGAPLRPAPNPLPGVRPASQPAVALGTDGTPVVAVRVARTGELAVSKHRSGAWEDPALLPPPGGLGTPELVVTTHPVLFVRNGEGTVSVARGTPDGFTGWTALDGKILDHPAAAVTPRGITLAGLGPAGRLLVNAQHGGAFTGWQPVG